MKKIISILTSLLFLIVAFSGCVTRVVPYESFDSLSELKDSIDDNLNIFFPYTTGYSFVEDAMYDKVYKGKSNVVIGYSFGGMLDAAEFDTYFWDLHFTCRILEAAFDERNPAPPLNANAKLFETDANERILDESEDPELLALGWYPKESKIVFYSYQFDLKECRYTVSGTMVIPSEELNKLDTYEVDAIVESSKKEMHDLVKSIIEQEK